MKKCISVCLLVFFFYLAPFIVHGEQNSFAQITISSNVPSSMMLAHVPLSVLENAQTRQDLSENTKTQELAYTWFWFKMVFRPEISDSLNRDAAKFVSGIGDQKDDAIITTLSRDAKQFLIIDSRFLTLAIHYPNSSHKEVSDIFGEIAWFNRYGGNSPKMTCETMSPKDSQTSWGKISVQQKGAWLDQPIEWYKDGDVIIFAFEKVLKHPQTKNLFVSDITRLVGGSPVDDERPYLRFDNSNRKQLAEDYAVKLKIKERFMNDQSNLWSKVTVYGPEIVRTTNEPPNPSSK